MKYIILFTFLLSIFNFVLLVDKIPFPIHVNSDSRKEVVSTVLKDLGVGSSKERDKLSDAILLSADIIDVSPMLVIAIMDSESDFNKKAVSPKGYRGLMQTPTATMQFQDVDTLHGARILEEKLKYCDNDLMEALILYKGGGRSPAARRQATQQAEEVYELYTKLKSKYGGTQ